LLDHAGKPTTNPSVMYTEPRGVVLPFGEHKGSGLALVCELLAGAIVGSTSITTSTPPERGILNGMLSIVIDPVRLNARDSMMAEIDAMIGWVPNGWRMASRSITKPGASCRRSPSATRFQFRDDAAQAFH
jgi:uncharacterized oxidoreductase